MTWLETILKNFPNAIDGHTLTNDIADYLEKKYGMTQKNTLFGFSTCADEINRTVTKFNSFYGDNQFILGGLTGYPFRGKTGFSAFSHHAPDNGNIIVLYGPHIGVNENGELGKIMRENQSHESTACGAAIAFLSKYIESKKNGKPYEPKEDGLDREQYAIEKMLMPYAEQILSVENTIKEMVEVNYKLIDTDVVRIVGELKHHFNGAIVLIGGIMINPQTTQQDYFDLRRFEMYHDDKAENLLLKLNAPRH